MLRDSWVTEELVASQEGPSSMELVSGCQCCCTCGIVCLSSEIGGTSGNLVGWGGVEHTPKEERESGGTAAGKLWKRKITIKPFQHENFTFEVEYSWWIYVLWQLEAAHLYCSHWSQRSATHVLRHRRVGLILFSLITALRKTRFETPPCRTELRIYRFSGNLCLRLPRLFTWWTLRWKFLDNIYIDAFFRKIELNSNSMFQGGMYVPWSRFPRII
jgi:hypothetical protein